MKRASKAELAAHLNHVKSEQRLQQAARKVEDFTQRLFQALKEQEQARWNYAKTAKRLTRWKS